MIQSLLIFIFTSVLNSPQIARLQYRGGDWYNNPSCLVNLIAEANERLSLDLSTLEISLNIEDALKERTRMVFMTGHGGLEVSEEEKAAFRSYLEQGGFIYIDDDYGFDKDVRDFISETFPDLEFERIPLDHIIYRWPYCFTLGLPKIHMHDGKDPEGWGIEMDGRLCLFYTYESNISDGWVDFRVYRDPEEIREQAFKMGINIISYAMTH
ncbi:DUF4159 domain-containing protein [candidate division WOR-3 bacterium]|nr:DUF4159 domain-containing protein [candidate division WOR-3 bacterium]